MSWSGQESCLSGLSLSILLKSLSVEVGIHLLPVEEQKSHLVKIFVIETVTEIWEFLMCCREGPVLPDGMLENSYMDLVSDVERENFLSP